VWALISPIRASLAARGLETGVPESTGPKGTDPGDVMWVSRHPQPPDPQIRSRNETLVRTGLAMTGRVWGVPVEAGPSGGRRAHRALQTAKRSAWCVGAVIAKLATYVGIPSGRLYRYG